MMNELFNGIGTLLILFCVEVFIVFGAMAVDLVSGVHKARVLGIARKSDGYKRTVSKFILYIGGLCIACGVDTIFFICGLWGLVGLGLLTRIPVVCTLMAIFLCAIEIKSIWEKAEDKQRKNAGDTLELLLTMIDKPTLTKKLSENIANAGKEDNSDKNKRHEKM